MDSCNLILASESPRRRELLKAAGFRLMVIPPCVDEGLRMGEDAEKYVLRTSTLKLTTVMQRIPLTKVPILAADTIVVLRDGSIVDKPLDAPDATLALERLSGRIATVMTVVATQKDGGVATSLTCSEVRFHTLSDSMIQWYVDSGEPIGKAGAFAIQGLGSRLVRSWIGCYNNIVGLPLCAVRDLIAGVSVEASKQDFGLHGVE